ncbi:hypothetical protein HZB60_04090 [candidate division KSB1 bacterium]|nr:hypothetical protein [candidate division KSB1 bacterium]
MWIGKKNSGAGGAVNSVNTKTGDVVLTPADVGAAPAGAYEPANANIQSHILDAANPHAVTAAQAGASPVGHTHVQAESHNAPDTDSAGTALHHTIGGGSNQAAAGNHNHSGTYEPVDATILRQANLAGSGAAVTPAKSDHDHTGAYEPANANIQSHILDAANPHAVTAAQVGNTAAQWNADKIQGKPVSATAPANGQELQYNSTSGQWEPVTPSTGGGSGFTVVSKTLTNSPYQSAVSEAVWFDASGGSSTMYLPTVTGNANKEVAITKTDSSANTVTVTKAPGDGGGVLINGAANFVLTVQNQSITVITDGNVWRVM